MWPILIGQLAGPGDSRRIVNELFSQNGGYQREIVYPVSGSRNLQLVSDRGMGVAYCPLWRIPTRQIVSSALSRRHARTRARYRTLTRASGFCFTWLVPILACYCCCRCLLSFPSRFFYFFLFLSPSPTVAVTFPVPSGTSIARDHRQWRNFKEKSKSDADRA